MSDCLFCKISAGEIPSERVFENEKVLAFRDISPQAPTHILIIPKKHTASADTPEAAALTADVFEAIPQIAKNEGLSNGYRIITNVGKDGRQSVAHLHFHLLGGKEFGERIV